MNLLQRILQQLLAAVGQVLGSDQLSKECNGKGPVSAMHWDRTGHDGTYSSVQV